jgi:tetratricopeptide (TPR) repeat protein
VLKPGALRGAVAAARLAGDDARVLTLLRHAADTLPSAPWPALETIAFYRDHGDKDRALAEAHAMLARQPGSSAALLQIGLLERARGNPDAALAAFEQAQAHDPDHVEALLQLSQETFTQGQQTRSDALLARALELDTVGIQALSMAAQRAMMAAETERGLGLFRQAIARLPAQPGPYLGAANALGKLGRTGEAMALLDEAIEHCGSRPGLHARRAQLLREMGFHRESRAVATRGLAGHPRSFVLWESVMRTQLLLGEDAEMTSWLAKAEPSRGHERALVEAIGGDVALELGDTEAAIACYERARDMSPANPRFHGSLVVANLVRFDVAGAHAHLRRQCDMLAPTLRLKNRSAHPQRTYFGQILNDYQLDAAVAAALAELPLAAANRIGPLRALCRQYPDSTMLAAALLDALRRSGAMWQGDAAPAGGGEIPRRIIQFWDSAPPPEDVLSIMASWTEMNPGFDYIRFDDLGARAFLAAQYDRDVLVAYHRATSPAMKADLFRLAYLARHGGVYVDADDRSTAPLAGVLPQGASLVLYREYLGTLGNNFLAAAPGHAVIRIALENATAAINRGDQEILWLSTGPGLITRSVAQVLAEDDSLLGSLRIWSRREMLRCISIHCSAGYKDTVQHWTRAAFAT